MSDAVTEPIASNPVEAAIVDRMSIRAFTPQPVARDTLEQLLAVASRSASGTNTQPWQVYVLQGASRDSLCDKVCAAHDALRADPSLAGTYRAGYNYNPATWISPYLDRRRENGKGFYSVLGIQRGETDRMHAQHQRNFRFFDAPVGLMFTLDRSLGMGSFVDLGMFMQSLMVAARSRGLETCPQAAWSDFASIVLPHVGAGPEEILICGMSLGHADPSAPINRFRTTRVPVAGFTRWLD